MVSCLAIPLHGLEIIFRDTVTHFIAIAQIALSSSIALISCLAIPLHGLGIILSDAVFPIVI